MSDRCEALWLRTLFTMYAVILAVLMLWVAATASADMPPVIRVLFVLLAAICVAFVPFIFMAFPVPPASE